MNYLEIKANISGKMKNPSSSKLSPSISDTCKSRRRRMPEPTRNWLELPPEVTANILHRLGAIEILESAQKVCTTWRKICKDPAMWRVIDMWNLGGLDSMPHDLEKMCRHAVDRSEGQLIDIKIENFGTAELLNYIADRSSQLRRLQVSCCYGSFYEGLGEVVKKLPSLEELSLNLTDISKEDIEVVGHFCPQLKSFKLNAQWYKFWDTDGKSFLRDTDALAIAKSMPQLRHLQLIGNQMTDEGLKAILDGCDRLESLDLRLCNSLKFEGSLGKRCFEQIKDLKRPNDSLKGCVFSFEGDDDGESYGDNDYCSGFVLPYQYGDRDREDDDDSASDNGNGDSGDDDDEDDDCDSDNDVDDGDELLMMMISMTMMEDLNDNFVTMVMMVMMMECI